jgi:Kef-type K+ transport system membrane component KefB
MFNLPRISIGLLLFNVGYLVPMVGIIPMLLGGYMLSRLMVDEFNAPIYFFIGVCILIPSFYMLVPFFEKNGYEHSQAFKYLLCLCGAVTTWLSVKK